MTKAADSAGNKADPPLGGETIVLFEDDDLVRRATQRMLQRLGAQVVVGNTSAEAVAHLREQGATPTWIIADYWFTRQEDGLVATKAVRNAVGDQIRALIITGDSSSEVANAVRSAGLHLLRKPVNTDRIIEILAEDA
ncbi:response regulator [Pelagibius sp.]|uniref:response regulator n=1 Tax=Pelagibius sp. TaxID=1931238 RepID=UPI0026303B63|nr:response regulator [Pelagibius sp.]